jgi:hypothetical protein
VVDFQRKVCESRIRKCPVSEQMVVEIQVGENEKANPVEVGL